MAIIFKKNTQTIKKPNTSHHPEPDSPGAAGPAVHTRVLSVVSSRLELQLMDNGLQPHTGNNHQFMGGKGGERGTCH